MRAHTTRSYSPDHFHPVFWKVENCAKRRFTEFVTCCEGKGRWSMAEWTSQTWCSPTDFTQCNSLSSNLSDDDSCTTLKRFSVSHSFSGSHGT